MQATFQAGKLTIILLFFASLTFLTTSCENGPKPPKAEKIEKELTIHNHTRIDPYYWLNERSNPEVIKYLESENEYTAKKMAPTEELQNQLFNEIINRIKQDDESVPYFKNGYFYYDRYEQGKEYPIYCRKKGSLDAEEEVMLNVNDMAEGYNYFQVVGLEVSTNNQILAYGVDTVGRRKYEINFKQLYGIEQLEDAISNTTGSITWANDNKTVFYTVKDSTLRPYKIYRHKLSSPKSDDVEVYHEKDNTFTTFIYKSKSDRYLFLVSSQTLSTEYQYLDADNPDGNFKIIQPRQRDLEYTVDHFGNHFYIRTNDSAKNFKLVKTPVSKTNKKYWTDVIAHDEKILFEDFEVFKKYLVVRERKNGLPQIRIIDWKTMDSHPIEFDEPAYYASLSDNPEFDTELVRYDYSSLTTPFSTFDYNMSSQQKILLKQDEVLGDFDSDNYQSERIFATADDGTSVPISLVYRKDKKKNNMPCLLYGYGSYGYSLSPYFSSVRLSLLDRGFIYAIAHIRGGEEMGREWYEDGKLLNKKNTFTDFIDCAEYLISENYTSPKQLFAMGGSAGGLLMGAVINMKPEIFKGVVAGVPFVDVITTMLDESIPLTTGEFDEWGNPKDKKFYNYMLSYSPYDNVEAKTYPALLVTTGLHDSQVQYWEPAKWVAKMRTLKTDDNLLLLKTEMEAGHSGTTGRFKKHRETALEYAFILDQLKK